jgi:taurine transport system permease protein
VVARLATDVVSGDLLLGVGLTLYRALAGFALAAIAGVAIGILIARLPLARWFFDPLVSIGLPMPKIAFLPIFILWFGVFDQSKILMAAFSAVFPVIVASWAAAEGVERVMLWSALSLGAGRRHLLWEIALPAALPQIFTGLQVALPISLIVEIVSEMAMGGEGIGGTIITEMRFADSPGVFSGIIAIAIVGSILVKAMELIRRRLLVWHAETAR